MDGLILLIFIGVICFAFYLHSKDNKSLENKARFIGIARCEKCYHTGNLTVCRTRENNSGRFVCKKCGLFDWKKIISQKNEFDESELNLSKSTKVTLTADSKIKECLDNFIMSPDKSTN
jgi:Zn ribbon nucleic-acid-binding protein